MIAPPLVGKQLPVFFARGYLYDIADAHGRAMLFSYFQSAAARHFHSNADMDQWLKPIYAYVGHGHPEPEPLDYRYVSLIVQGMLLNYPNTLAVVGGKTKAIGKSWWFDLPPAHWTSKHYSLSSAISPSVVAYLQELKQQRLQEGKPIATLDLPVLALARFVDVFRSATAIPCSFQYEQDQITASLDVCPFCLGETTFCRVWPGILESVFEWIHGIHLPNALNPSMQINEAQSTAHTVVLDVGSPLRLKV